MRTQLFGFVRRYGEMAVHGPYHPPPLECAPSSLLLCQPWGWEGVGVRDLVSEEGLS